jgi:K+-sensing histidine kinase KdpD
MPDLETTIDPSDDAEWHLARSHVLRFEGFLERRSPAFVVLLGLLLVALIAVIDAVSGRFTVSVLFLVPVALVTFSRGRGMGLVTAILASIAWCAADVAGGVTSAQDTVTYLNGVTRLIALVAITLLVAPMRDAVRWQRELAERESESNDQLRALNELRDALQHPDDVSAEKLHTLSELRDSLDRLDVAP